jgi:hypothetical protein
MFAGLSENLIRSDTKYFAMKGKSSRFVWLFFGVVARATDGTIPE